MARALKGKGKIEDADRELKIARELDPALPRSRQHRYPKLPRKSTAGGEASRYIFSDGGGHLCDR
jgi:hypothetical protein